MIKSFIEHLDVLKNKKEYELIQNPKKVKVNFLNNSPNESIFTINFSEDTHMMSLRKDNYLIDEIKVYNDTTSGDQSLSIALKFFIDTIDK
jgi:hypothetical protein